MDAPSTCALADYANTIAPQQLEELLARGLAFIQRRRLLPHVQNLVGHATSGAPAARDTQPGHTGILASRGSPGWDARGGLASPGRLMVSNLRTCLPVAPQRLRRLHARRPQRRHDARE